MEIFYQSERSECGLVSLAMIASAYGLNYDLATLRARYPVSLKGSTLKGLMDIARDLQLESRALRCDIDDLGQLRLPAILHWRMDHFVVLAKRRGKGFIVNDPAIGQITLSTSEMSQNFTGVVLEVWTGPKFQKANRRNRLRLEAIIPRAGGAMRAVVMMFILALGVEVITLLLPVLQQLVIDDALVTGDADLLKLLTIAAGGVVSWQTATTTPGGTC